MMQMAKERDRALLRFFGICLLLIVACIVAIIAVNTGLPQGIY
jgi:predicted lysophospholipase L1 biosynthesis ABC-type transport system permease subunit